ncbi:MAG: PLP-dependent aminotransferase family protein [Eubacteriales bacterium]|nr:PLP-dependent aminotransferase family protein [Eubacteriales bacterium]
MTELGISFVQDGRHLYEQIYDYIKEEIREGKLLQGERLPSTRSLAQYLQVSRSTVQLAYDQLLSEGYLIARKNRGYYICEIDNLYNLGLLEKRETGRGAAGQREGEAEQRERERKAERSRRSSKEADQDGGSAHEETDGSCEEKGFRGMPYQGIRYPGGMEPDREKPAEPAGLTGFAAIDFSPRRIDMTHFPYATWKKISKNTLTDARSETFALGEPNGDLSLRKTIARYLHLSRGVICEPEQIVVGAGNDYLLMLLRQILGEGRSIGMENPTYLRAYRIFHSFGYTVAPIAMDGQGMRADSLEESGCDLAYVMPSHQFPTGIVMPITRRAELLRWADAARDRYLIEDDYDSEFRYRGKPVPSLQASDHFGRVIYIGTFSKSIAPAIRISFMILPYSLLERYYAGCRFFSSTVSRLDQSILNEFIRDGYFERYLNKMRNIYRGKHDLMLQGLQPFHSRFLVSGAGAGLHLLLTEKERAPEPGERREKVSARERTLAALAAERGVLVYPMSDNRMPEAAEPDGQTRRPTILLGYAALQAEEIAEGLRRLQEVWL